MASFPTKVVKTNITKLFDAMDYNDTVTEDLGQAKVGIKGLYVFMINQKL